MRSGDGEFEADRVRNKDSLESSSESLDCEGSFRRRFIAPLSSFLSSKYC